MNLADTMRQDCPDTSYLHFWGYGYLDKLMQDFCEGRVTDVILRRQYYMLTTAFEVVLNEMRTKDRDDAIRRTMIRRERALTAENARITDR